MDDGIDQGGGAVNHRRGQKKGKIQEAHLLPSVTGNGGTYGFPDSIITKLRYCDLQELDSPFGAMDVNYYRANGIFDPDAAAGGHQPMFRDNFSLIYNDYVVLGSKISVNFTPYNVVQNWICGVTVDDNGTISPTLTTKMEANNSNWGLMSMGGSGTMSIVEVFSPEMYGVHAENDQGALVAVGADPALQFYYGVWAHAVDATISTQKCYATVEIEYTVKFSGLVSQAQN